jgi:hypothetical protein
MFEKMLIKSLLPSVAEHLPKVESVISDIIAVQQLEKNERRTLITLHNGLGRKVVISLAAVDENDAPVRVIQKMGLSEFIKKLIEEGMK